MPGFVQLPRAVSMNPLASDIYWWVICDFFQRPGLQILSLWFTDSVWMFFCAHFQAMNVKYLK